MRRHSIRGRGRCSHSQLAFAESALKATAGWNIEMPDVIREDIVAAAHRALEKAEPCELELYRLVYKRHKSYIQAYMDMYVSQATYYRVRRRLLESVLEEMRIG